MPSDGDRRMAEAFLHGRRMNPEFEGERRPRVAETVQGQPREPVSVNMPDDCGADSVRVEAQAVRAMKHQPVIGEVLPDEQSLLEHPAPMITQTAIVALSRATERRPPRRRIVSCARADRVRACGRSPRCAMRRRACGRSKSRGSLRCAGRRIADPRSRETRGGSVAVGGAEARRSSATMPRGLRFGSFRPWPAGSSACCGRLPRAGRCWRMSSWTTAAIGKPAATRASGRARQWRGPSSDTDKQWAVQSSHTALVDWRHAAALMPSDWPATAPPRPDRAYGPSSNRASRAWWRLSSNSLGSNASGSNSRSSHSRRAACSGCVGSARIASSSR
jgi:hypothetical protein